MIPMAQPELHPALQSGLGKVLVEYVWLGATGKELRSKTKVMAFKPETPEDVPVIVVDSSRAPGQPDDELPCGEVFLKPRKIFRDPFRGGDHVLVLCDTFQPPKVDVSTMNAAAQPVLQPHVSNNRAPCENLMNAAQRSQPVFAVQQEYTAVRSQVFESAAPVVETPPSSVGGWPHSHLPDPSKPFFIPEAPAAPTGWPHSHLPDPTNPFYVPPLTDVRQTRASTAAGRRIAEAHLKACLHAGLKITEVSQGCSSGAWSYKLGPLGGLDLADELWMSRFVASRLSEEGEVSMCFDPNIAQPGPGGGGGCCVKFSTLETRQPGSGLLSIQQHLERLQAAHVQHMMAYGKGSLQRLPCAAQFSCSIGNRAGSIMIPTSTTLNRGGYYADQRPAANMDPYLVTSLLVATTLGVPLPEAAAPCCPVPCKDELNISNCDPAESHMHWTRKSDACAIPAAGRAASRMPLPQQSWSAGPGCSYDSDDEASLNTEDLLIDELDRIDGFAPDTPNCHNMLSLGMEEGYDESSTCTSPETSGSLLGNDMF